jgi:hypothetical protein
MPGLNPRNAFALKYFQIESLSLDISSGGRQCVYKYRFNYCHVATVGDDIQTALMKALEEHLEGRAYDKCRSWNVEIMMQVLYKTV